MDFQALVDGMAQRDQRERSRTQMTLGSMIATLKGMSSDVPMCLGDLDSYRGYYCDLAFEPSEESKTVAELLEICQGSMGQVFTGYKGGDYMMGANTPIWLAHYGGCGKKIMAILPDGTIETEEDD